MRKRELANTGRGRENRRDREEKRRGHDDGEKKKFWSRPCIIFSNILYENNNSVPNIFFIFCHFIKHYFSHYL